MPDKGFTLIEVIISIAVMTIIIIPILSLFTSSKISLKYSGDMARELGAARSAMEWYNKRDFTELHHLLGIMKSRSGSASTPSLYCFIEYSDVSQMSAFLDGFDAEHCKIYENSNDYNEIKELSNIKYDTALKINLFETFDTDTGAKTIEIVVTAWSSLRSSSSEVRLVCMKGECI